MKGLKGIIMNMEGKSVDRCGCVKKPDKTFFETPLKPPLKLVSKSI